MCAFEPKEKGMEFDMKINLENGRYVNVTIQKNSKGTYEYYIGDILVGVYAPNVMGANKFMEIDLERNNTIANELSAESKDEMKQMINQIKEKMNQVQTQEIEEEARENAAIDGYLQEIGMDRRKVKITFMDLDKKEEKEESTNKDKSIHQDNIKGVTNEKQVTTSDVDVKQEIDLGERATDVEDFKKWLGGKLPKDAQKVGVIDSNEMSQMKDEKGNVIDNPSTQLGLIVINKDKKVEPLKEYIPELEQNHSSGNNPIQSQYQIHTDGTVEKDPVISEYRIGRKIIQLDKDHGDDLEVNIGKYSPHGNELVTTRMRDRNTQFATDIDTRRAAMGHYKGVYESRDSYQEAQKHEEAGCTPEELTAQEIDGEQNTGHQHFTKEEFEKCVKELMQKEEISEVFTEREVRKKLASNIAKKGNSEFNDDYDEYSDGEFDGDIGRIKVDSIEEIKKQTREELEDDAAHFKTRER